jgi:lysine-N-methylase
MQQSTSTLGFSYIENFRCLADKCADNCCSHNWRIAVNDEQAQNYLDNYPSLYNIIAKDSDGYRIQNNESGCMAQDQGLCIIHRDHGESLLSDTCADYPRMYRSLSQFYTRSGTMSCPEIARKCLFDDHPFALQPTELPDNHKNGTKLQNQNIAALSQTLWQETISDLMESTLDKEKSIEETLSTLWHMATKLEQNSLTDWPKIIMQSKPKQLLSSLKDIAKSAEHTTDLLYMLLENLDRPSETTEHLRQLVIGAFTIHSHDLQNRPRCQLKQEFKDYYQNHKSQWLQSSLKRFVAAEITRTGFPFISHTSNGKDYGTSLKEWTTTLCLRTLTLRLLLSVCGTHYAADRQGNLPDENSVITWVYNFCRKVNHTQPGNNEMDLRQAVLDSQGERLYEYFDFMAM